MFEIFPWNSQFDTGIGLVDEQHRRLVDLLNQLAQHHAQGAPEAEVKAVLGELADYAIHHFRTEEAVWRETLTQTIALEQHVRQHQRFFEQIASFNADKRPFKAVLDELFPFLVQWLVLHILDDDKRMAYAAAAVQRGLGADAALAQAQQQMSSTATVLIHAMLKMNQALAEQAMALTQEKRARQNMEVSLHSSELRWQALLGNKHSTGGPWSDTERRLHNILHHLPAGVAVADIQTQRFVFANPRFCQMVGYNDAELSQMGPVDIHPAESLPQVEVDFKQMSSGWAIDPLAIPVKRKDGSIFIANIERVPLHLENMAAALAVFTDITEHENARAELDAERLRLRNAIDAAHAGTWEWDLAQRTVRCSSRIADMLGQAPDSGDVVPFEEILTLMHPDDLDRAKYHLKQHLDGQSMSFEIELRLRHRLGHWVWWRNLGRVMQRSASGDPVLLSGLSIDVTEQRNQSEQIDHLKHHDAVTGMPNRRSFVAKLSQAMADCSGGNSKLGVAYLDLDGLTGINTRYGREVGNEVVLEIGRRLVGQTSAHQFVGHIGGDEFAVMLSDLGQPEAAADRLQRLLAVVAEPICLAHLTLSVTASIGMAPCPQTDHVDAEQLLRQADQAMYLAKLAGKNRYHLFDPVNDESQRGKLARIDDIRRGLLADEFVLYYQPKVNLLSGAVIGFEALIRWQHPTQGLLMPGLFIPLLNQHPVAITLGDWVIEHALQQIATWQTQGLSTVVSVNIDAMQLHDPDFIGRLQRQLHAQPTVLPSQLELEILETGAMENMPLVSALVSDLQDLGISCSLDDFGTGYSSLTFLKQLTAHTVKIDKSFVLGMLDDAEDATIVNSVLSLAHTFDRRALAEGVETEAHGRALIEFNCEFGQGYAIAHPMPSEAVLNWIANWKLPHSWKQTHTRATQDVAALLAETEHRAWLKHLHAFVAQQMALPPSLSPNGCRFGQWLSKPSTRKRFGQHPDSTLLTLMHNQLHVQAEQVVSAVQTNKSADVSERLASMDQLSDEMLSVLHRLRDTEPDSQWSDTFHNSF